MNAHLETGDATLFGIHWMFNATLTE